MNELPLISVIIPFYNIDEYIAPCIDSLLCQEFDDFEIVCIDDGSTDGTPGILDEYAHSNENLHVIHCANAGVSAARNTGVVSSRGKYITFVDGDDVVSPYYLKSMYETLEREKCDLVIGRFKKIGSGSGSLKKSDWKKPTSQTVCSSSEIIDNMLYENPMIAPWAHLCKREVYVNNPFAVGRIFEDTLAFKDHVFWAQSVAVIDEPIYGYVCRQGSITDTSNVSLEKLIQLDQMLDEVGAVIAELGENHEQAWLYHLALEYSRLARLINTSGIHANTTLDDIYLFFKENYSLLMHDEHVSLQSKFRFFLLRYWKKFYYIACDLYEKLQGQ